MMRRLFLTCLMCILSTGMVALWLMSRAPKAMLPTFAEVRGTFRPSDISLLDRSGEVLHERRLDPHGRRLAWTPLADISPAVQEAVVASEDRHFFHHGGVDARALLGAMARRLVGQRLRGASTISMQLVSLIASPPQPRGTARTLSQKWRQIHLAWALEGRWSKAEIFEAYLNLVSYRGELQGIAAAAHVLFGKAAHGIDDAEAAVLAVLIRGPNADQATVARRAQALRHTSKNAATPHDINAAVVRTFRASSAPSHRPSLAPHVAQRLLRTNDPPQAVQSTLDSRLQAAATQALRRHLMAIRAQRVQDGAVLVVENATGEVLAYVASSGDLSSARYVDGIQARRQTGSLLKPFLYGLALERKILTAASLLEDTPLDVAVLGGLYRPRNYDERFRGLVSLRTALSASLNIPAVRALELVGAEAFVQQLRRLGLQGARESGDFYGPSLALGSVDASLWELVQAYRTLAMSGMWTALRLTPSEPASRVGRRVYSDATAFLLSHILSDRDGRSFTFGLENPLATRFWSAVKTGTSKEMRDNWCIGYTAVYTVGVWVGNLSGEPMHNVTGVSGAAPIWGEIMDQVHQHSAGQPLTAPVGVLQRLVSFPDGLEPARREWFLQGTEPQPLQPRVAAGFPRISTPVSGEIIALDPDIPIPNQRVVFVGNDTRATLRWLLDGNDLGPAVGPLLWEPVPGPHTLALIDEDRRTLDSVSFEVRPRFTRVDPPPSLMY